MLNLAELIDRVEQANTKESVARSHTAQTHNEARYALKRAIAEFAFEIRPAVVALLGFRSDSGLAQELEATFKEALNRGPDRG